MRFRHLIVAGVAAGVVSALALAAPAAAKGAQSITVSGPGLAKPVTLPQNHASLNPFTQLTMATKVDHILYGDRTPASAPPSANVGPAYDVVFDFDCALAGPNAACQPVGVKLIAYPFAESGPLISVPAGQKRPYEDKALRTGWFRAGSELRQVMVKVGVPEPARPAAPAAPPAAAPVAAVTTQQPMRLPLLIAAAAGALALLAAAIMTRRSRTSRAV